MMSARRDLCYVYIDACCLIALCSLRMLPGNTHKRPKSILEIPVEAVTKWLILCLLAVVCYLPMTSCNITKLYCPCRELYFPIWCVTQNDLSPSVKCRLFQTLKLYFSWIILYLKDNLWTKFGSFSKTIFQNINSSQRSHLAGLHHKIWICHFGWHWTFIKLYSSKWITVWWNSRKLICSCTMPLKWSCSFIQNQYKLPLPCIYIHKVLLIILNCFHSILKLCREKQVL